MPQRHLKNQPVMRSALALFAFVLITTTITFAQTGTSFEIPISSPNLSWQGALSVEAAKQKVFVVTLDKPDHKQSCRVQSFTVDKLICSRAFGGLRTYLKQQVVAIILPGDGGLRLPMWIGFNGGLGASIWGTVVLAVACPACAAGTALAALFFFGAAGATAFADDQPDKLLYLTHDQELSRKLGYIQQQ